MNKTKLLLSESWNDFTADQQIYLSKWENELWPLIEECIDEHPHLLSEGTLTNDQILSIFKQSEELATQSGDNVTKLGKAGKAAAAAGKGAVAAAKIPIGIAKKIDQKVNELGALAQKAGPIKNADAKFEELKKKISDQHSDSKIVQGIQKVSDWAKANPTKASLALGILTTVAAFAGGPAGGAAAGFILRGTKDLLSGDKLSTAVGKGVKTGVYGFLAGKAFEFMGDQLKEMFGKMSGDEVAKASQALKDAKTEEIVGAAQKEFGKAAEIYKKAFPDGGKLVNFDELNGVQGASRYFTTGDVFVTPEQLAKFNQMRDNIDVPGILKTVTGPNPWDVSRQANPEYFKEVGKAYQYMQDIAKSQDQIAIIKIKEAGEVAMRAIKDAGTSVEFNPELKSALAKLTGDAAKDVAIMKNIADVAAAVGQGAVTATTGNNKKDDKSEVKESFENLYNRNEDILNEDIKGALKSFGKKAGAAGLSAAGKAIGKTGEVMKDLGNKVTANKLMKAWKKAGSPTDSAEVYNILSQGGVDDEAIKNVATASNVELEPSPEQQEPTTAADPQQEPAAGEQPTPPVGEAGPEIIALKDLIVKNDVVEEVKLLLQRQLNPGGEGGSTAAGGDSTAAPTTPGADGQPATDKPKENLSTYFNNWIKQLDAAASKGDKIKLTKELVNTVADRGDDNNSQAAISLLQKYGKDIDPNVKNAAMQRLKDRVYMEKSFFNWFKSILAEHYITLPDIGFKATLNESFENHVILIPINKTSFRDIVKKYR